MGPAALLIVALIADADASLQLSTPTSEERLELIRRGLVCRATDVASNDLYEGPKGTLPFAVDEEIRCEFVPKPLRGLTPKFLCRLPDGAVVKVKYDKGRRFKEVFGEVLGTRLFWALGFYADKMLPIRVACVDCPEQPWKYVRERRHRRSVDENGFLRPLPPKAKIGTYTFDPAAIEERLDAQTIETRDDEGWSWKSLDQVDPRLGGATRAEIDALKLLNAFVQNADNKAKQNSLVCPKDALIEDESGHVTCSRPILYVDDLGSVFGQGGIVTGYSGRVDYDAWKRRQVWRDSAACQARLKSIGGCFRRTTLKDPVVSEEGRALLAERLAQLSDAQIADLFRASRIERLHQTMQDGPHGRREVTVEDWVALFKLKRDEITLHPECPTRLRPEPQGGVR